MASERRSGAGGLASGVLEGLGRPKSVAVSPDDPTEAIESESKGRAGARKPRASKADIKGRTIYLPEPLFERIMVQAHRKGKTISEYVTATLERHVPSYRTTRDDSVDDSDAA